MAGPRSAQRSMVGSFDNIDIPQAGSVDTEKEDANAGNTPNVEVEHVDYPETIDETSTFPYDPIESQVAVAKGYPTLNFKPLQIKTFFLGISATFFLCCTVSIAALVFSGRKTGYSFHAATTQNYMAFRYTPAIVGTITTILWRTIITTLGRITPYISMASPLDTPDNEKHRRLGRTLEATYTDASAVFTPVQNRHWLYFLGHLSNVILTVMMVPLKASLFQLSTDSTGWVIVILPHVAYTLMAMYGWLVFCSLAILIRLYNRETGLKWDPVSLVDQMALVQGSNCLAMYQGLEYLQRTECSKTLRKRSPRYGILRLGYWQHRRTKAIWHGIAFINSLDTEARSLNPRPTLQPFTCRSHLSTSMSQSQFVARPTSSEPAQPVQHRLMDDETSTLESEAGIGLALDYKKKKVPLRKVLISRHRDVVVWLYDLPLFIFIAIVLVILSFIIKGLINHRIQDGLNLSFDWTVPMLNPDSVFIESVSESLVFRTLPVFLMGCLSTIVINADYFYRHLQPFASMKDAAPASENILLDYPSAAPVWISIKAAMNGHWQVAVFSLLSLAARIPPILASSVFQRTPTATGWTVTIAPFNFWVLFVILILYVFVLIFARPSAGYRLPRTIDGSNSYDVITYCYASRLLTDKWLDGKPILSAQAVDDTRVHLESRIHLAKQKYAFGLYYGVDCKWHVGFDAQVRRVDDELKRVYKISPGRFRVFFWHGWSCWWRARWAPKLSYDEDPDKA